MKTLTSLSTIKNLDRHGVSADRLYKRLAIFFDDIIFNRQFCPIGSVHPNFFKNNTDFLANICTQNKKESNKLANNKKFKSIFIDSYEFVDDERAFELGLFDVLPPELMDKIFTYAHKQKMSESEFIHNDEFKQLCGDMWHELQLYTAFKKHVPDVAINLTPDFGNAISLYSNSEGNLINEFMDKSSSVPDFGDLSWDQIFELREDRFIKNFRDKISSIIKESPNEISSIIEPKILKGLWDIASYANPNVGETVLNGFLTNLPLPLPVNPYGVYRAVKDVVDTKRQANNNGWMFFIQKARCI